MSELGHPSNWSAALMHVRRSQILLPTAVIVLLGTLVLLWRGTEEAHKMQFVIGWLKLKPGKREEFVSHAMTHQAITQKEEGCLFYEWHPSATDKDGLVLIEGWKTHEHHLAHQAAPHHEALGQEVGQYAVSGRFEEIEAASVVTQLPEFSS